MEKRRIFFLAMMIGYSFCHCFGAMAFDPKESYRLTFGPKTELLLSKSEWTYGTTDRFTLPIELLQNKAHMEVTGVVASNIEVISKHQTLNLDKILKQKCDLIKAAYGHLSKSGSGVVADVTYANGLCTLSVANGVNNRSVITFLTKRTGETGKYSYTVNSITFHYPPEKVSVAKREIASLSSNIKVHE
jgi:hypothetical protein